MTTLEEVRIIKMCGFAYLKYCNGEMTQRDFENHTGFYIVEALVKWPWLAQCTRYSQIEAKLVKMRRETLLKGKKRGSRR